MIRVELLGRPGRSPWPKVLLSVLVLCGGLYGFHRFFPALTEPIFRASSALMAAAQQEIAPPRAPASPVQATAPKPAAREATPSPEPEPPASPAVQREAIPTPPQRSTTCHHVMQVAEQVPAETRVASLNCNASGEYWLEGTSLSYKALRAFRLRLQALPSRVSFATWWEERTLRFSFQGHFAERATPPPTALSPDQAEQFFGKVARWADASGLDSLSVHEPIHKSLSPDRTRQRQKLRGIGAPQQINAFLQQLQQAKEVATLGEVLLMPITSGENGWGQARLYAAVDIIVDRP